MTRIGAFLGDGAPHSVERGVDLGMQPVVEVAVLLRPLRVQARDGADRPVPGGIRVTVCDLCRRFRGEVLVLRGCLGDVRGSSGDGSIGLPRRAHAGKSTMSWGLTKLATSRKGRSASASPFGPAGVAILEPRDHTIGDERIATNTGIAQLAAVGFGADPSGEAERVQPVGASVQLDAAVDDVAIVVVRVDPVALGIVEVGMADVPLAVVVRVVAGGAEPVAEGRNLALPQPAHP